MGDQGETVKQLRAVALLLFA